MTTMTTMTTMTIKSSFIRTVNEMINKKDFTVLNPNNDDIEYDMFEKDGFNYTIMRVDVKGRIPAYAVERTVFPYKNSDECIYDKGIYRQSSTVFKNIKNDKLKHMWYNIRVKRQTSCQLCKMFGCYNCSDDHRVTKHNKTEKHNKVRRLCGDIITNTTKLNNDIALEIMSYL